LGNRELGPLVGLGAALAAAIMPLYHPFRHILFSDPWVITLSVMTLFHCAQWADFGYRKDWGLAMASFSLAVALKLTPLYLLLPLGWIAFRKNKYDIKGYAGFVSMVLCAMILPLLWYAYAYYLTVNFIDVFGIFQGHNKMQTFTMLSDPEWYRTLFLRIRWNILGGKPGILLCMAGVIFALLYRKGGLFFFYLTAIGFYFAIVAEGQLDAAYRQLTIIPPLAVFIGLAPVTFISFLNSIVPINIATLKSNIVTIIISSILILNIFSYNAHKIFRKEHEELRPSQKLGSIIKNNINENGKIIALGEYTIHKGGNDLSPRVYYYGNVQGWTLEKNQLSITTIEELRKKGATMLVARNIFREKELTNFVKKIRKKYKTIYYNKENGALALDLNAIKN
jgi:hypothetical protein